LSARGGGRAGAEGLLERINPRTPRVGLDDEVVDVWVLVRAVYLDDVDEGGSFSGELRRSNGHLFLSLDIPNIIQYHHFLQSDKEPPMSVIVWKQSKHQSSPQTGMAVPLTF